MDVKSFLIKDCSGVQLFRSIQVGEIIINNFYIESSELLISYLSHISFRCPNIKRSIRIQAARILILFLKKIN